MSSHAERQADLDPMDRTSSSRDLNMTLVWLTGIVGSLIIVTIVLASQAAFQYALTLEHRKKVVDIPNSVNATIDAQEAQIAETIAPAMEEVAAAYASAAPAPLPDPPAPAENHSADHGADHSADHDSAAD